MADEKKSPATTPAPAAPAAAKTTDAAKPSTAPKADNKNGKGDAPRNCFSESYRSNFEGIDWSK